MKWAKGEISNFTYLMILNHAAGWYRDDVGDLYMGMERYRLTSSSTLQLSW